MDKFERDFNIADPILKDKKNITHEKRMILLMVYNVAYHDSGKIEGMQSCDSSCNGCDFCQEMRKNLADNPLAICNLCYDHEQETRWVNVKNRHGLNLRIMSEVEFTREELATLPIYCTCRFNSSGDIQNETMAKNYLNIAYSHPLVNFGLFAKNVSPVIRATDALGKPDNVKYIQSSVIIGKPAKRAKYFDIVFTVYPDEETTETAIKDGAMECNGKKCKDCGFMCYLPNGWKTGTNVAEVLRVRGKNKRAEILKAYMEET